MSPQPHCSPPSLQQSASQFSPLQVGRPQAGGTSRPGSAGTLGQPVAKAVAPSPRVIMGKAPSPISPAPPPLMQLPAAAPGALAPVLAASKPPMPVSVPPAATSPQATAAGPPPSPAAAAQAEAAKGASEASRAALPAPATAAAGQGRPREAGADAANTSRDGSGTVAAFQSKESGSQGVAEEPSQAATGGACHLSHFVEVPSPCVNMSEHGHRDGSCLLGCVRVQTQWCTEERLQVQGWLSVPSRWLRQSLCLWLCGGG